jgi:DNA-directed RNA polymerase subunit N (RpoN/RPB10)
MEPIACDGLPVRCFTCGRVISHLYNQYYKLMKEKKYGDGDNYILNGSFDAFDNADIIKKLGLNGNVYCCYKNLMAYPFGTYNYI